MSEPTRADGERLRIRHAVERMQVMLGPAIERAIAEGHGAEVEQLRSLTASDPDEAAIVEMQSELRAKRAEVEQLRAERDGSFIARAASAGDPGPGFMAAGTAPDALERLRGCAPELGFERPAPPDLTLLLAVAEAALADPDAHILYLAALANPPGYAADSCRARLAARLPEIVGRVLAERGYAMPEEKRCSK